MGLSRLGSGTDDIHSAHPRTQDFRNFYGPIRLLVIFEHGDQGARHAQSRAVQRMDEAGLAAVRGTVLDIGPARLEVGIIRHRGDLQPLLLSRRPDLDIVRHGCAETNIAGAQAA